MEKKRKLAFYEIHSGVLADKAQKSFENIQRVAMETGRKTQMQLTISVMPPESKDDKYGKVSYKVTEKLPAVESIKLTTEINGQGIIVSDGKKIIDVLQEQLEFNQPIIHKIEGGSNE